MIVFSGVEWHMEDKTSLSFSLLYNINWVKDSNIDRKKLNSREDSSISCSSRVGAGM